ncbi:hypothetical protein ATH33_1791 [Thermoactinomyces vulgaris]|nr:hypothetical protein ATH33_1791 [Thermoactinomyces vulgaris]
MRAVLDPHPFIVQKRSNVGKIAYSQNIHEFSVLIIIHLMIKIYINGIRRFFL